MALSFGPFNSSSAGRCASVGSHYLGNAFDRPVRELRCMVSLHISAGRPAEGFVVLA